jgi:galactan 5-O-arabinofuranosyltransferase
VGPRRFAARPLTYSRRVGDDRGSVPIRARTVSALVVGAVVAFAAVLLAVIPPARIGDPTVDVAARLFLVVIGVLGAVVVASRLPLAAKGWLSAFLVGAGLVTGAALILSANGFGPLGAGLDQSFRTAALTKFAAHWGFVDFAYGHLPAWYPPLSFWLLGRAASLLHVAPWRMLKVGLLAAAFLVPIVTWPLWSRVAGRAAGLGAVIGGALLFQNWYEWYAWLAVAVFVPWWLWSVLGVGPRAPRSRAALVVAALVGAALVGTYYYYFFIGATQLILLTALRPAAARRGLDIGPRSWRHAGVVLGGTVVLSAIYWLPVLVSMAEHGTQALSNRFYNGNFVDLHFPFLNFDLVGVLLLVGLAYLVVTAWRSPVSLALLTLLGAAYAWSVLGYLLVLVHAPLLSFRANDLIDTILAAGAGLAAAHLWRAARESEAVRARLGRSGTGLAALVTGTVLVVALGQQAIVAVPYVNQQRSAQVPTQLLADFDHATGGRAIGHVVLTDVVDLPVFRDVDVFNVWSAHYAHPAALFSDRTRFLVRLSQERDPRAFAIALAHNTYDRIDFVALRLGPTGSDLSYSYGADNFPSGSTTQELVYPTSLFATPLFDQHLTDTLAVFSVRRANDPARSLTVCARVPRRSGCAVLAELARRYPGDLDAATTSLIASWEHARRA